MGDSLNTPSGKVLSVASDFHVYAHKIPVKESCYMTESGSSFAMHKEEKNRLILALSKALQY